MPHELGYTLHVYKDVDKILAVYVQDPHEYSAIYQVVHDPEAADWNGGAMVASNLSDINGDIWDKETWHEAFMDLFLSPVEAIFLHQVPEIPLDVIDQYDAWLKQARE